MLLWGETEKAFEWEDRAIKTSLVVALIGTIRSLVSSLKKEFQISDIKNALYGNSQLIWKVASQQEKALLE